MHWLERWLMPPQCVITGLPTLERDISTSLVAQWKTPQAVCPQCCEPSALGEVCGACLTQPPAFDRTQVGFYFDQELIELIHGLKYQNLWHMDEFWVSCLRSVLMLKGLKR